MREKRILSVFLAVVLCVSMLPVSAMADEDIILAGEELLSLVEEAVEEAEMPGEAEVPEETEESVVAGAPEEAAASEVTESTAEAEEEIPTAETEQVSETLLAASGTCGDNLTWTLDDECVLTISGSGALFDNPETGGLWGCISDCDLIKSVIIEDGITSIGYSTFVGFSNLTSVTIPASVTSISGYAFNECYNLLAFNVSSDNENYCSLDGVLFTKDMTTLLRCPSARCGVYNIPDSVTIIGDWAFCDCQSLTNIVIPDSVVTIENVAFFGCTNLTSMTIPDSVTSIGGKTFYQCSSLEEVTFLGNETNFSFLGCDSLLTINIASSNENYCSVDGVVFTKDLTTFVCYPTGRSGSYTIPDSVSTIDDCAFWGCEALKSVTIPDSVSSIGIFAFGYCSSLTSVTIPDSVTTIGYEAFYGCESLTSVTIPDSVTTIGDCAFNFCESLTDVYYSGSKTQWNAIGIGSNNSDLTNATIHYNWGSGNNWIVAVETSKEQAGFYIYDVTTKAPVSGVKVQLNDGPSGLTDTDGTTAATLRMSSATSVTLSKDGYTTQTIEQTIEAGYIYVFYITPTADVPTIFAATAVKEGTGAETNILKQKIFLKEGKNTEYTLNVYAGYDNGIKEYRLIQEGKVLDTSEDGKFTVTAGDFEVESSIYLLAVGNDGKFGKLCKTNLIVKDNIIRDSETDSSMKLGDEISFTVDSTIPLLGGQEISIDLSDLPLYVEVDGDKVKIAVNAFTLDDDGVGGVFSDDTRWQGLKDAVNENMNPDSYIKKYLGETLGIKAGERKPFTVGSSSSMDFKVWGYLEGSAITGNVSGTIKLILDASVSNEWQAAVGPVPVVITLEISGSLEGGIQSSMNIKTWEDAQLTGTISPSISIDAGAGPGFANVASVTINGKGTLDYTATWNSNAGRSDILKLIAKLYIKFKVLFAEYKKDIAEKTWVLYESATAPTALSAISEADVLMAAMDVDNYSVAGRDYLADTSPWMGEVSAWGVARSTTQSAKLLQSSIYEDTQLQIVQAGDTVMAFFLTDDPLRADVDRTMLVYTVYDPDTDTWSAPAAVEDDGTADFYPSVSVSDGTIYVAWSDMKEAVGEVETLDAEAIVGGIEITAAKYEDGVFTAETITDDGYMDTTPAVYGDFAVWGKSKTNNMLGNDDSSVLCLYNGESVSELRNTANVVELDIGSLGGTICIALVTDGDGDYSTMDDRTMTLLDTAGNTLQTVSEGAVAEVAFTEDGLCWYEDGYLRCLESAGGTSVAWRGLESVIPGPWQIAEADGKTYLLFLGNVADEANSQTDIELFAYIYDGSSWSNAVQLTELGLSIQNFEAYSVNGTVGALLTISEMDTSGEETTETVSLCAVTVIENTNYALVSFDCDDVVAKDGSYALDFTATTVNIGSGDGGDYSLELQYDRETVSSLSFDGLSAGESTELEGTFILDSAPVQEGTYTICLNAEDTDDSDNSTEVVLGLDDLAVEFIDYSISEDFYAMSLTVANNGLYSADAELNVRLGSKEGEVLLADSISISAGNNESFLVTINTKNIEFAEGSLPIWYVVTSEHEDSSAADNEGFFIIYRPDEHAEHTEHVAEVTEGVDPTCTENGFTEGSHCGICGEVLVEQEAIPATGHNYESSVTAPTCAEQGYTTHVCTHCGDSYVDSYVPAGHTWDGGVITKEPTEDQDGEITYTCSVCGETIIETLSREIGDITGDGDINVQDLVRLMKYIAGMDVEVVESECDTNRDDKIDILDVIRFIRHLAG